MPHRNAPLSETGRLRLARCVVEDGWPLRRAAERFQVSPTTAQRWADRYRQFGEAGMCDRSSRQCTSPRRTPTRTERRIIKVRLLRRWGPARIAHLLRLVPSTVHRVLARFGLARLTHLDRATGQVIRRYERAKPGELVHVDIKKLGNIPHGGGHKVLGRQAGRKNRKNAGYSYLHTAVDDHSRLAYSEIHADEKKETATAFWTRAQAFFTQAGITVERVLTDNGSCYRSRDWRDLLAAAGIVYWRAGCKYCLRLRIRLGRSAHQLHWVDIWRDPAGATAVRAANDGDETVPTVVFAGQPHVNPDPEWVRAQLSPSTSAALPPPHSEMDINSRTAL